MAQFNLTTGIVADLVSGVYKDNPHPFVVQVQALQDKNGRFRVMLSDGLHLSASNMLNSSLGYLVHDGDIKKGTVIRVNTCNVTGTESNAASGGKTKMFAVLVDVTVVGQSDDVIGHPSKLGDIDEAMQIVNDRGGPVGVKEEPLKKEPVKKEEPAPAPMRQQPPPQQRPPPQQPPKEEQKYQPPPRSQHNGNTSNNNSLNTSTSKATGAFIPIKNLNPYQGKWTVKGRVISKSDIRKWNNQRGEGWLFNFELKDDTGTVKVTGFKEDCDRIFPLIEEGDVITLSRGNLKPKDARYNKTDSEYEITLQRDSHVEVLPDDGVVPKIKFEFKNIGDIENFEPGTIVDVVGVVKTVADCQDIVSKKGQNLTKRELTIVDRSKKMITLTLWGDQAKNFQSQFNEEPVMAIRQARVGDFGGRTLGTIGGTKIYLNDADIPEINELRGWWSAEGKKIGDMASLSGQRSASGAGQATNWKCFKAATEEGIGRGEKPGFYSIKASVVFLKKDNVLYQACSQENCNKKVQDMGSDKWRCEKCNKVMDTYKWRMMLSCNMADWSDNCWATLFQESAEALIGMDAQKLGSMKEDEPTEFDNKLADINFNRFTFRMRAKEETYNDETRLKTTVVETKPFDPLSIGATMDKGIDDLVERMGL